MQTLIPTSQQLALSTSWYQSLILCHEIFYDKFYRIFTWNSLSQVHIKVRKNITIACNLEQTFSSDQQKMDGEKFYGNLDI